MHKRTIYLFTLLLMFPLWERKNLQQKLGARIFRYADDIVTFYRRSRSSGAMTILRQTLERLN